MKRFVVRLTHIVRIEFDDDRATEKSARHVAEHCLAARAYQGDSGTSRTLGWWNASLDSGRVESVEEE